MKNLSQIFCALSFLFLVQKIQPIKKLSNPELFQSAVKNLSDIIVYDIFSPPVASSIYVPHHCAYEIMAQAKPTEYKSLAPS